MQGDKVRRIDSSMPRVMRTASPPRRSRGDSSPFNVTFDQLEVLEPFEKFEGGSVGSSSSDPRRRNVGFHHGGTADTVKVETKIITKDIETFTQRLVSKLSVPMHNDVGQRQPPKGILKRKLHVDSATASSSRSPPLNAIINREKNRSVLRGKEASEDELASLLANEKDVPSGDKINHRNEYRAKIYEGNAKWMRENVLGLVLSFDVESKLNTIKLKETNDVQPSSGQNAKTVPIICFKTYPKYLQEWQELIAYEMCAHIERAVCSNRIPVIHRAGLYAERSAVDGIMEVRCDFPDSSSAPFVSRAWDIFLLTSEDPYQLQESLVSFYDLLTSNPRDAGSSIFQIAISIPSVDNLIFLQGCAGGPVLSQFPKHLFGNQEEQNNFRLRISISRLCSLQDLVLQVEALGQIKSLHAFDSILDPNAETSPISAGDDVEFKNKIHDWLHRCQLSLAQKKIIETTCHVVDQGPPFILIKGPPGVGKTTTMLHALNCWQVSRVHQLHTKLLSDVDENIVDREEMRIPRVLICSPNISTIDHIERCIKQLGFLDGAGNKYWPPMIRVGSNIPECSADISATKRLNDLQNANKKDLGVRKEEIRQRIEFLREKMRILQRKLEVLSKSMRDFPDGLPNGWECRVQTRVDSFELENGVIHQQTVASAYFVNHTTQSTQLHSPPQPAEGDPPGHMLAALPEFSVYANDLIPMWSEYSHIVGEYEVINAFLTQDYKTTKEILMATILNHTNIVLSTLEKSAMDVVRASYGFDVCVVEDAGALPETSVLVPMKASRAWTTLLVGDPTSRVPSSTSSFVRNRIQWDYPMMERLARSMSLPSFHLTDQYRVHPDIVQFTSTLFPECEERPFESHSLPCSRHLKVLGKNRLAFWNLNWGQEEGVHWKNHSVSMFNREETKYVEALVKYIRQFSSNTTIALLSDYDAQYFLFEVDAIIQLVKDFKRVSIFRVEEFVQQEADVVIVSCVRSTTCNDKMVNPTEDRLLKHLPTLHLALTRARQYVVVIGNADMLISYGTQWTKLINFTERAGSFKTVSHVSVPTNESIMELVGVTANELPKSPRSPPDLQSHSQTGSDQGAQRKKARTDDAQPTE